MLAVLHAASDASPMLLRLNTVYSYHWLSEASSTDTKTSQSQEAQRWGEGSLQHRSLNSVTLGELRERGWLPAFEVTLLNRKTRHRIFPTDTGHNTGIAAHTHWRRSLPRCRHNTEGASGRSGCGWVGTQTRVGHGSPTASVPRSSRQAGSAVRGGRGRARARRA